MSKFEGKRVLLVGPASVGDMAWFVALALERAGARVTVFDDRAMLRVGIRGRGGALLDLVQRQRHLTGRLNHVRKAILDRSRLVDFVITIKGENFSPDLAAAIAKERPVVNWYVDYPIFDQVFESAAEYTLFCVKDAWSADRLLAMGLANVAHLRLGSDPTVLGGTDRLQLTTDLVFVGTMYPYREHWLVRASAQGCSLQVWGARRRIARSANCDYHTGPMVGRDQGRALRSATASLNLHHPMDLVGGNMRTFDIPAAGALQITEELPETTNAFERGFEILTFKTATEFDDIVREVRSSPERFTTIAAAGHRRLLAEHTYDHRIDELFGLLAQ